MVQCRFGRKLCLLKGVEPLHKVSCCDGDGDDNDVSVLKSCKDLDGLEMEWVQKKVQKKV